MISMRGEGAGKFLSKEDADRRMGRILARALELCGITKQQAADRAGYENATPISKWVSGMETAQIGRLWSALGAEFQQAFIVALAHDSDDHSIEVRTTVTVANRKKESVSA